MVESSDQAKVTFIAFIRHGERCDLAMGSKMIIPYENNIRFDPPLTAVGLEQAAICGRYFRDRLREVEELHGITFDEVVVESSPFVRCL